MRRVLVMTISVMVSLILLAGRSGGAVFCVSTATELQNALTAAATNGEDDVIKVVQGAYIGNFAYYGSREGLKLLGGYTSGCASRVIDPSNTVLDGGGSGRVLICRDLGTSGDILIEGFTIKNGNISGNGGGVKVELLGDHGTPGNITLSNNIITGNTGLDGGGVYAITGSIDRGAGEIVLSNNIITGNVSHGDGGGVYAYSSSALRPSGGYTGGVTFINNIIAGNASPSKGGGIYVYAHLRTYITLVNNTITENYWADYGGGAYLSRARHYVYNNIIWRNTAYKGGDIYILSSGISNGYNNDYSDMSGNWDNSGNNIDTDPLFVGGGDYHLQSISPCIDAGTNEAPDLPCSDFEGDSRIVDGDNDGIQTADMGADEFVRIIHPPLDFNGQKVLNRSLSQAEYINVLAWQSNPNNENILKYRICQVEGENQNLLVELNSDTFEYWHRRVEKNKSYTYHLVAVNEEGSEGVPAYITIN